MNELKKRLIVGISGASGAPIAVELLKALKGIDNIETHLVITHAAKLTIEEETNLSVSQVSALADILHETENIGAPIASGSFKTDGMIIVPCSMKSIAAINSGYTSNLMLRAADVTLKEHRKLVLVPRECPFSNIHLRNLYELSQMGCIILPPMLTYYNHPKTIEDTTRHIVGKILCLFDINYEHFIRWEG